MIYIDYQDATPIYEQIVNKYKNLIVRGAIKQDEQMPSVRSLAMELSINPNTIQKAYTELERQGYIYSVKGRGNFVSAVEGLKDQKEAELLDKLDGILREAYDAGVGKEVLEKYIKNWKIGEAL